MTLFTRCDTPSEFDVAAVSRGRFGGRRHRAARLSAFGGFLEEIGILFRYATGRDYYDRRLVDPKN